jgi:predicted DNA-binding protein with PD1-like motif
MKSTEGQLGRVFIVRLEDGDTVPASIEHFAEEKKISVGQVILIGGIGDGEVVVGPRRSNEMPPESMLVPIDGVHEVVGVGIIAPDKKGKPNLHIHASLGRSGKATTGCLRPGVTTWLIGEVIILEIKGTDAVRMPSDKARFELLEVSQT